VEAVETESSKGANAVRFGPSFKASLGQIQVIWRSKTLIDFEKKFESDFLLG
jgi:hypothetical protein